MSDLPKRNISHVNSTISYIKLRSALPPQWTMAEVTPDYGIDYSIEIWKEEQPIGRICNIQLKHKQNYDEKGFLCTLQINISTINYLYMQNNSFVVVNEHDDFSVLRVKQIKEIIIDKIIVPNAEQKQVSIPFIFQCPFDSDHARVFWIDGYAPSKMEALLGGEGYIKKNSYMSSYYLEFSSEENFWRFHTYLFVGYYYSLLTNKAHLAEKLENLLADESEWGKCGIYAALDYMGYRPINQYSIAKNLLQSKSYVQFLIGIRLLAKKGDDTNIDKIDSYFLGKYLLVPEQPISENDETYSVAKVALESLGFLETEKANQYLLNSLTSKGVNFFEKSCLIKIISDKCANIIGFEKYFRSYLGTNNIYLKYEHLSIDDVISSIANATVLEK